MWGGPCVALAQAGEIAKECCQSANDYELYPVGKAVGNVKNQEADLLLPLSSKDV